MYVDVVSTVLADVTSVCRGGGGGSSRGWGEGGFGREEGERGQGGGFTLKGHIYSPANVHAVFRFRP